MLLPGSPKASLALWVSEVLRFSDVLCSLSISGFSMARKVSSGSLMFYIAHKTSLTFAEIPKCLARFAEVRRGSLRAFKFL